MPIIIDTNCISTVFSKKSLRHKDFEPVLNWILYGKGIMVIGGTKYREELKKMPQYLKLIRLIKESGKLLTGNDEAIDRRQREIESLSNNPDFDDPHLPAIIADTKCRLICSVDTRSVPYVTDNKFYPKGIVIPSYYTSARNKNLLCDTYVDNSLKPLCKISKIKSEVISKNLN